MTCSLFLHVKGIGAWNRIPVDKPFPYSSMHIWESVGKGKLNFNSTEFNQPSIATIIENNVLKSSIVQEMLTLPSISLYDASHVSNFGRINNQIQMTITKKNSSSIHNHTTRLLVGADGIDSPVRKFANIGTTGQLYDQVGLVATLKNSQPFNYTAYQRFLPDGPIALLPVNTLLIPYNIYILLLFIPYMIHVLLLFTPYMIHVLLLFIPYNICTFTLYTL